MIKSIKTIQSTDKEKYKVPKKVQDVIPIKRIWPDGIFQVGSKFVKSWKFADINYLVASREDKESMFLTYSELLNSLDSGATTKITINNHRMKKADFEESVLMPLKCDGLDDYRRMIRNVTITTPRRMIGSCMILRKRYFFIRVVLCNKLHTFLQEQNVPSRIHRQISRFPRRPCRAGERFRPGRSALSLRKCYNPHRSDCP